MKKKQIYFIFISIIISIVLCLAFFKRDYISRKLDSYAFKKTTGLFGHMPLAKEQEKKIKDIAHKMGVFEPITICKMNCQALRIFGYYNAFACWPTVLGFLPISNKPFLFVSEGFFEDLSEEEQTFLIGHEMVHIKERHLRYFNLIFLIVILGLFIFWWSLKKYIRLVFKQYVVFLIANGVLLFVLLAIPDLIGSAYRRYIEREADCRSISILKSYDGGIKLINRWTKEFGMPEQNSFFGGLLEDHPSCLERKECCLELKNKLEGLEKL